MERSRTLRVGASVSASRAERKNIVQIVSSYLCKLPVWHDLTIKEGLQNRPNVFGLIA